MMQNFGAPIAPEDWPIVTTYLTKNFPEPSRPSAVLIPWPRSGGDQMWDVPTLARVRTTRSRPRTARSGGPGNWPTSSAGRSKDRAIREYTLKTPHTGPHGLVEDKDGNIWFTGNHAGLIGKLDPKTGLPPSTRCLTRRRRIPTR